MKKKFGLELLFLSVLVFCIPAAGTAITAEEFTKMYESLEKIDIGGALRVNYTYKDWDEESKDKVGDFGLDTFRLNLDGEISDLIFSAEYRWYPESDWDSIHHGWIGYNFTDNWQGQIGIHQVPFGIQPYASHNFWFSGAYYYGLEDDYDAGIKALYNNGPWDLAFAFYKNGELSDSFGSGPDDAGRYSVDVLTSGNGNEETNQGNLRCAYTFTHNDSNSTEFGLSGEYGGLRNEETDNIGDHWAGAAHIVGNYGRWNIQLEGIYYKYDPENPDTKIQTSEQKVAIKETKGSNGETIYEMVDPKKYPDLPTTTTTVSETIEVNDDLITVGAYEFPWQIPAEAAIYTFNVAYTLPVKIGPISSLTFYSDNTAIKPDEDITVKGERLNQTIWQNVVGCLVAAGPVYTYIDVISSEEMVFNGDYDGMVDPTDDRDRNTRLNINIGYYF